MRKLFSGILIVVMIGIGSVHAEASKSSLSAYAQKIYGALTDNKNHRPEFAAEATKKFRDMFDFRKFDDLVTIDIQGALNAQQCEQLKSNFEKLFFANFQNKVFGLAEHRIRSPQYTIVSESDQTYKVSLAGKVADTEAQTSMTFYIRETSSGTWLFHDMDVSGALLSRNYRGTFNKIFRDHGFSGLNDRILEKTKDANAEFEACNRVRSLGQVCQWNKN